MVAAPGNSGRRRFLKITFVVTIVIILLIGMVGALLWPWPFADTYEVATLRLDEHYSVRLTSDVFWEVSQPVYLELLNNGKPVHRVAMGYTQENVGSLDFSIISTSDRRFHAAVELANPDVVLMFYDANSNVLYPGDSAPDHLGYYARMNVLLDKLRAQYPDRRFVLSRKVPGNRDLRISG